MTKEQKTLRDIVVYKNYAKYLPELGRREDYRDVVARSQRFLGENYPRMKTAIKDAFALVKDASILPSMRMMQFAGKPIDLMPNRLYNCSFMNMDDTHAFSEMMYLLLGGSGVGYSVQEHHISKLPKVVRPAKPKRYMVGDDIKGWADSVKALMSAYFSGAYFPRFDFSDVRKKGTPLKTSGGRAPGSAPLQKALTAIEIIMRGAIDRKLTPIEVSDIACHIAEAVMAGGIRRAACICLFSFEDQEMMDSKTGNWLTSNPQRCRANISVALVRSDPAIKDKIDSLVDRCNHGGFGEPGVVFISDPHYGTNPCSEIALEDCSVCNLTEVHMTNDFEELEKRVRYATLIATLQAGFTDFWYLRKKWQRNLERNPLIGVSLTGIAGANDITESQLAHLREVVREVNVCVSDQIEINPSSRVTCVKPSGSTSLVMGTSSGIHSYYAPFYKRTVEVEKHTPLGEYLMAKLPSQLYEDSVYSPQSVVVNFPIKAPDGAIVATTETIDDALSRLLKYNKYWIGADFENTSRRNNVSCSLYAKGADWEKIKTFLKNNYTQLGGVSIFPMDDAKYAQPVLEAIDETRYKELQDMWKEADIDLTQVHEGTDETDLQGAVACAGGACEIT